MRTSKFSPEEIAKHLARVEEGLSVPELARELGISTKTIYLWRRKFGGMAPTEAKKLKSLEDENARLKRLVASQALDITVLKDLLGKAW